MLVAGMALEVVSHVVGPRSFSDVGVIFEVRRLGGRLLPYLDVNFAYPSGIGVIQYVLATLSGSLAVFASLYALAVVGAYLATRAGIASLAGASAASAWATAPLIGLYLFHNYDAFVIAAAVGSLWAFDRRRYGWSGVWLGVAVVTKIYPGFWLLPLVVSAVRREGRRSPAVPMIVGFVTTIALFNVPLMAASWSGWRYPYEWQSMRPPNWESVWAYVQLVFPQLDNPQLQSAAAVALVAAVTLLVTWRVDGSTERLVAACFACTAAFLAANRVYSPQYTLWLVPFVALLGVDRRRALRLYALEVVIYVGIFVVVGRELAGEDVARTVLSYLFGLRLVLVTAIVVPEVRGRLFVVETATKAPRVPRSPSSDPGDRGDQADAERQDRTPDRR